MENNNNSINNSTIQLALPEQVISGLKFEQKDLFLNLTDPELKYRRRNNEEKTAISFGQRKLVLGEIQFLSLFWDPKKVKNPIMVVAGAAPAYHYSIIELLFPELSQIALYDPRPCKIKETGKIKIYQQLFTDDTAKEWAGKDNIIFISDIRSSDYTQCKNIDENEIQIMKDMEDQMRWYKIIRPYQAMLKCRFPYQEGNSPSKMNYLYGFILKQPYAPNTSTETRLVPIPDREIIYDCLKYESQLYYYNTVVREKNRYLNPISNDMTPIDGDELTNDHESRAEYEILSNYFKKRGVSENLHENIKSLSRLITEKLNEGKSHKDTLAYLRANPQAIKKRNMKLGSRDDIPIHKSINKSRDDIGFRGKSRDDNHSNGFRGKSRDDNHSNGFRGKSRDDNHSNGFRGKSRDDNHSNGFRGKSRDDNHSNGFRGKSKNNDFSGKSTADHLNNFRGKSRDNNHSNNFRDKSRNNNHLNNFRGKSRNNNHLNNFRGKSRNNNHSNEFKDKSRDNNHSNEFKDKSRDNNHSNEFKDKSRDDNHLNEFKDKSRDDNHLNEFKDKSRDDNHSNEFIDKSKDDL